MIEWVGQRGVNRIARLEPVVKAVFPRSREIDELIEENEISPSDFHA
jgi:hypothetical protein